MSERGGGPAERDERPREHPSVRVWGILRGHEMNGAAVVSIADGALVLVGDAVRTAAGGDRLVIAFDALDGARADGDHLTIFPHGGDDVIELSGPRVNRLADELLRRACELPEQTLRLRHFGAGHANPGSDHDRFFAPLLEARRRAGGASVADQLASFDSGSLHAAIERTLHGFAADRFRRDGADRRALEAELFEVAEPLLASVDALGLAAAALREGPADVAFARWRAWSLAAQRVFAEADRAWAAALPALADSRGRRGRLWRRVLRLER